MAKKQGKKFNLSWKVVKDSWDKIPNWGKMIGGTTLLTSLILMGTCNDSRENGNVIQEDKYIQGMKVSYVEDMPGDFDYMKAELGNQTFQMWKKGGANLEWDKAYSKLPKYEKIDSMSVDGEVFSINDVNSDHLKKRYSHLELKKASDLYHKLRTAIWTDKRNDYYGKMKHIDDGLEESKARVPEYEMDTLKNGALVRDMTPKPKKQIIKDKTPAEAAKTIDMANKMLSVMANSSSDSLYSDSYIQSIYDQLTQARLNLSTNDSVLDERLEECQARIEEMRESSH